DGRLDEEREERELHAGLLGGGLEAGAEGLEGRDGALLGEREVGRRVLRAAHALADPLPGAAGRRSLLELRRGGRDALRDANGRRSRNGRRRLGARERRDGDGAVRLEALHVVLGDATVRPRRGDLPEVDPELARELAGRRRGEGLRVEVA